MRTLSGESPSFSLVKKNSLEDVSEGRLLGQFPLVLEEEIYVISHGKNDELFSIVTF